VPQWPGPFLAKETSRNSAAAWCWCLAAYVKHAQCAGAPGAGGATA